VQADILHGCPDDAQATGLRREDIDLIGPLPHIAEQTLNGIGGLNMPMHALREGVKREGLLFFLAQTSHCLWIALAVFGFEGHQLSHGFLFGGLLPDSCEFGGHLSALPSGDGIQDIALLMHQTALTRGGRKQFLHGGQQAVMSVGDDQIDVSGSTSAQIVQ
jgi:hypothetical protein